VTTQTGQADNLADRLVDLEQSVRRAAEVIAKLRAERDALQGRLEALEPERAELRALRQERKEMLGQVDAILKELDRLEL
jgi:predicted  nucleic acid-binding Zn-ribbon protein